MKKTKYVIAWHKADGTCILVRRGEDLKAIRQSSVEGMKRQMGISRAVRDSGGCGGPFTAKLLRCIPRGDGSFGEVEVATGHEGITAYIEAVEAAENNNLICEDCDEPIPQEDIREFQAEAGCPDLPRCCSACAETAMREG